SQIGNVWLSLIFRRFLSPLVSFVCFKRFFFFQGKSERETRKMWHMSRVWLIWRFGTDARFRAISDPPEFPVGHTAAATYRVCRPTRADRPRCVSTRFV